MALILCHKCGETKQRSEFYSRAGGKHRTPCKTCINVRKRAYEIAHASRYLENSRERMRARRARLMRRVRDLKMSLGCIDCGYKRHPAALHFDHVAQNKNDFVSRLMHNCVRWDTISLEIAKCQVRCIVCHRKRTKSSGVWAKSRDKMPPKLAEKRNSLHALRDTVKAQPCSDCGGRFPPYAMDFDHLQPSLKRACIGNMAHGGYTPETLQEEIAKCRVLCANCHAIRTDRAVHPSVTETT